MANLTPKQGAAWRLLRDQQHTEILYGGSAGGGKTRLGCTWEMASAIEYQGSRWLMGRSVLKTLKQTTLASFFDQCKEDGLQVGRDFTFNAQSNTLYFGASEIILMDMFAYPSDPNFDELGSLELTGAFGDEVNQWSNRAKSIVTSRIRYKLDQFGIIPKFLMTCNPAKNWVYREFYHPWRDGTLAPHRAFVPARVTDNPHISPEYIKSLERMEGPDRERLLLGNWDYDDDPARLMSHEAIMDLWTNTHVLGGTKYIVVDVAGQGRDKTVITLWEGLRLVFISTMDKNTGPELLAAIEQLAKQEGVGRSRICVDADGIGGMGIADYLPGCVRFNGGSTPVDVNGKPANFQNLKAQCSYLLADHVNDRLIHVQTDGFTEEIQNELGHVKSYKTDTDGKMRVLPKEKVIESLGHSPDYADVFMMRMYFELKGGSVALDYAAKRGSGILRKQSHDAAVRRWGLTPRR